MEDAGRAVKGDMMKAEELIEKAVEYCEWMNHIGIMSDIHFAKITTYLELALDALAEEDNEMD